MKNLNTYAYLCDENNDSFYGYLLEYAVKDHYGKPLTISKAGKVDIIVNIDGHKRRLEVKQNGGDFRHECKGSSYIAYAMMINPNKPLAEQWGYVMPMATFRKVGYELHHILSEKPATGGGTKMALQSLYNYTKVALHGKKALKLEDAYIANGAIPFSEFFA